MSDRPCADMADPFGQRAGPGGPAQTWRSAQRLVRAVFRLIGAASPPARSCADMADPFGQRAGPGGPAQTWRSAQRLVRAVSRLIGTPLPDLRHRKFQSLP